MFTSPGSRSSYNRLQASMRRVTTSVRGINGGDPTTLTRSAGLTGNLMFRDGNSGSADVGKIDFGYFDWNGGGNCLIRGKIGQDPSGEWANGANAIIRFWSDPYGGDVFAVDTLGRMSVNGISTGGIFSGPVSLNEYIQAGVTSTYTGCYALGPNQSSTDLFWARDAPGIWASFDAGTGTNPQSVRVYNTTDGVLGTPAVNYERAFFDWQGTSNVLSIGTEAGGTGTVRNMQFKIGGTVKLDYGVTNSGKWTISGGFVIGVVPKFAGTNTTGSGSAALGSNSPATTNTAPYTWIQATAADGSTVYIPAWK
jgi:hypothetical protein